MRHRSVCPSVRRQSASADQGFTLIETLVALAVLLIVMGIVMSSMMQFSQTQGLVWNRSNMHSGVRSATELLQQEVGQAGRASLDPGLSMSSTVPAPAAGSETVTQTVTVTSTANMFVGEHLVIDAGTNEETVTVLNPINSATSFTAEFSKAHTPLSASLGVPVTVRGGFASGVVPTTMTNGSSGTVLKIYGDINGDGNMVYVEYVCTTGTEAAPGNLYRNTMAFSSASKPVPNAGQILLSNLLANPGTPSPPCFSYEQKVVSGQTYVINVAITLTTQTQVRDRVTKLFQTETKALLNVAPRNVFETWQLASMGSNDRIQPMPPTVAHLLAPPL